MPPSSIPTRCGPVTMSSAPIGSSLRRDRSPVIPALPGLSNEKVLTNETIFALRDRPSHLLIVGGGPIGIEMALAHRRLGARVTVIARSSILPRDEPELVEILRGLLKREGIEILEGTEIASAEHTHDGTVVTVRREGKTERLNGSHLLVATGRAPRVAGLGLDAAGIAHNERGIVVDARLRTTRRHVFALGDVIDAPRFTHVAGYQAGIIVRNLAFRLPAKVDYEALPWVTYTDPELAHVGLTEAEARKSRADSVRVERVSLEENDRAVTEHRTAGSIKIVLGRRDRILGVSILAPAAGEMAGLWCLAIKRKLPLRAIADLMLPYPTMSEIGKAAAGQHYRPTLFGRTTRRLVRALQCLPAWWTTGRPRHVVLVGAGHAHVEVLRSFAERPPADITLTLVTRSRFAPYSGMLPGLIAGLYREDETRIDTQPLAQAAGATIVHASADGVDTTGRHLACGGRPPIPYDVLSFDIGSTTDLSGVPGAEQHAIPVRPIDSFSEQFERLRRRASGSGDDQIAVVGGGAAGVELALSLAHRLRIDAASSGARLEFVLVSGTPSSFRASFLPSAKVHDCPEGKRDRARDRRARRCRRARATDCRGAARRARRHRSMGDRCGGADVASIDLSAARSGRVHFGKVDSQRMRLGRHFRRRRYCVVHASSAGKVGGLRGSGRARDRAEYPAPAGRRVVGRIPAAADTRSIWCRPACVTRLERATASS